MKIDFLSAFSNNHTSLLLRFPKRFKADRYNID